MSTVFSRMIKDVFQGIHNQQHISGHVGYTGTFINARVQGTGQCWSRRIWNARAAKANFGLSPNHPCSSTGVINWGDQCRNLHAFPGLDLQKFTHFWIQRRSEPFKLGSDPWQNRTKIRCFYYYSEEKDRRKAMQSPGQHMPTSS